jgi:DNA-binding transcriptional ArsR family regulator
MSAPYVETQQTIASMVVVLSAAAAQAARTQWTALAAVPDAIGTGGAIIDPEALLLLTTWMVTREPDLSPIMHDWVAKWSDLLSVQRTRNLAKAFPARVEHELRAVAITAHERGKDFRWSPVIKGGSGALTSGHEEKAPPPADLHRLPFGAARLPVEHDALLVLRFRMAFGVGARADALAFLMARGAAWSTVAEIAHATGYTPSAIRRALDRMAEAEIVLMVEDGATRYRCDATRWGSLLGLQTTVQPWCYWMQHFTFVAAFVEWADNTARRKLTSYAITEGMRSVARTYRPSDDRDATLAWDYAFRDDADIAEMEAALTGVAATLLQLA